MSDLTVILNRVEQGDPQAAEELLPLVYEELRELAAGKVCLSNSLDRLVRFYEATGQSEKVAEWNEKPAEFDQTRAEK